MSFQQFLDSFAPQIQQMSAQCNLAAWDLETTGSKEAGARKIALDTSLRLLLSDRKTFEKLKRWDDDPTIEDPLLKRQLNVLIRMCTQNLISRELLEKISQKEADLCLLYSNFRPSVDGKILSELDMLCTNLGFHQTSHGF